MTNEQKSSFINFAKTVGTWVGTIASFLGGIKEIKDAIDGEPKWLLLIVCAVLTLGFCLLVILRKKKSETLLGVDGYTMPVFPRSLRTCAWITLVTIVLSPLLFWGIKPAPEHFFKIVVANVDGPTNYGISETLITSLRKAAEKYPNVKIVSLQKSISPQEGSETAKILGTKEGADIVVWGWCKTSSIKTHINLRCEILADKLRNWKSYTETDAIRGIHQLEGFELQKELGDDMTSLALLFLGASMTINNQSASAFQILSDAANRCRNTTNLNEAADIFYWRGISLEHDFSGRAEQQQIADFTEAISRNPKFTEAYINRGSVYIDIGKFSEGIADCDKALKLSPGHTVALANRATALALVGRYDEAIADAELASKTLPNEYIYKVFLAQTCMFKGETDRALAICSDLLKTEPKNEYALLMRANALRRAGRLKEAIASYTLLLKDGKLQMSAYFGRGNAYSTMANFPEAESNFSSMIKLSPECADAYYFRAQARYSMGNLEPAVSDLGAALSFQSNLKKASPYDVYMSRGQVLVELKKPDYAITNFTMAISFNAKNPDAYAQRGLARMLSGSFSNAVDDISKSLEQNPNSLDSLFERACAFIGLNEPSNAILDLNKYIALTTNNLPAYGMRASANLQLDAIPEALSDCSLALQATNDSETLKNAHSVWWAVFQRGGDTSNRLYRLSNNSTNQPRNITIEKLLIEAEGGSLSAYKELEILASNSDEVPLAKRSIVEIRLYFKLYRELMQDNRILGDTKTGQPRYVSIDVVLFNALPSPFWTQREAAVYYLAKTRNRAVVPHLCDALFSETNLYVISDITRALNDLTGTHHEAIDLRSVSSWWSTNINNVDFFSPFVAIKPFWGIAGILSPEEAKKAIPTFDRCINASPEAYWARCFRAGCYCSLHQFDLAEKDLEAAKKTSNQDLWWLFYRAELYIFEGKADLCAETINQIILYFPDSEEQIRSIFGHLLTENSKVKWSVKK